MTKGEVVRNSLVSSVGDDERKSVAAVKELFGSEVYAILAVPLSKQSELFLAFLTAYPGHLSWRQLLMA